MRDRFPGIAGSTHYNLPICKVTRILLTKVFLCVWSAWPVEQLSDMVRVLVLWHWGGIYSDTDVISIKPFTIPINAVGLETKGILASGFFSFKHHNPILWKLMEDYNKNFNVRMST